MDRKSGISRWTADESAELYGINNWGNGLFSISGEGDVQVTLTFNGKPYNISLSEIVLGLEERGYSMPLLLRFPELLENRIRILNETFRNKIQELEYRGSYRGVFPVKVNQQQQVIEEIVTYGGTYHHGLEAGSKAELMIALSHVRDQDTLIVCNGYKDSEFIDLALYGRKMGLKIILVIERPGELSTIMKRADILGIEPWLGIRAKLSSTVGGKWAESAGDLSVFGLNSSQIYGTVRTLAEKNRIHWLKLLHYHMGSQIPDIRSIRNAVTEAGRYYSAIVMEGAPLEYLDIGGGLAVDYDGSKTNFSNSKNYSIEEYCGDVVEAVKTVMDETGVPHPVIVTESGRALVAYYSVLLFNILDVNRLSDLGPEPKKLKGMHELIDNLLDVEENITVKNLQEMYHDAIYYRDEVRKQFLSGDLGLAERGLADQIFWRIVAQVTIISKKMRYVPEELQDLEKTLADIYYGNFSLFQSLPDTWAIDHLFPVMPIHRLNEKPERHAIIADITCDCDGKLDKFIDLYDVANTLPLHNFSPGDHYVIGAFLIGAYQETLGDLHNLFGDTNVISVSIDEEGEIEYIKECEGDTIEDVLGYVEYDPKGLVEKFRLLAEESVVKKRISPRERRSIMQAFLNAMQGYTYFEENELTPAIQQAGA